MRQLGLVADERAAQRFADYLLTQGIAVSLEPGHDGCRIWVRNEDHLEAARREFSQFNAAPDAPVYQQAGRLAEQLRTEERKRVEEAKKNLIDVRTRWRVGIGRSCPVTILLMAASIAVAIFSKLGDDDSVVMHFSIDYFLVSVRGNQETLQLAQIWRQEPWRLVTPIFLHFGIWHLLFNMVMLIQLGAIVEAVRGSWRFAIFVLLIAVPSNIAQYLWSGPSFGGMSGVLYGLFGYVWMKSRFEPASGFYMPPNTVIWMVAWFVLCVFGVMGHVANVVHGVGFAAGLILGRWPSLWRSLRR
jgi:rhomboid protease GlpG